MKKLLAILMAATMVACMCSGCGGEPASSASTSSISSQTSVSDFSKGNTTYTVKNLSVNIPSYFELKDEKDTSKTFISTYDGNSKITIDSYPGYSRNSARNNFKDYINDHCSNITISSESDSKLAFCTASQLSISFTNSNYNTLDVNYYSFDCPDGAMCVSLFNPSSSSYNYDSDFLNIVNTVKVDNSTNSSSSASSAPSSSKATVSSKAPVSSTPSVPIEYKNALASAETYVNTMHLSKRGVYDQLTSEYGDKFSNQAAQYAIDNIQVDWNKIALASAKEYQDSMQMSPAAIHDQLTSDYGEKFTQAEADYAIQHLND